MKLSLGDISGHLNIDNAPIPQSQEKLRTNMISRKRPLL